MSTTAYKILVVDDQPSALEETRRLLTNDGFNVDTASSGDEAVRKLELARADYAVAVIDYRMEGKNGAETNRALIEVSPKLNTIFLSADDGRLAIKDAWYTGARCFIEKGDDETLLREVKQWYFRFVEEHAVFLGSDEMRANEEEIRKAGLVGCSTAMLKVVQQAQKFASMKDIVRIEGETGVGKERIARLLHLGPESKFFPVNCAHYHGSHELMQGELYGYKKGYFTGAVSDKRGIFDEADGGTVVLDEIGTLSLKAQQSLYRVIREKKVRPGGASQEHAVDFRLVVASKPDFEARVHSGEVAPDFFERVNVLVIRIPPLRERPEDIPPLVDHFCKRWENDNNERKYFLLGAVQELKKYDWPRNVAQLEHAVIRLCANVEGEKITRKDVKEHLDRSLSSLAPATQDGFQDSRRQQTSAHHQERGARHTIGSRTIEAQWNSLYDAAS